MDPRNSATRADAGPSADPFEQSLTQHQQRIDALRAVKTAQQTLAAVKEREARCIANAEANVQMAEEKAAALGAYDLIPANLRPIKRTHIGVAQGGAS